MKGGGAYEPFRATNKRYRLTYKRYRATDKNYRLTYSRLITTYRKLIWKVKLIRPTIRVETKASP